MPTLPPGRAPRRRPGSRLSPPGRAAIALIPLLVGGGPLAAERPANLATDRLVAWCIVPFDAVKRSPEERAAMLAELGLTRCAYDWREEHVPTFEREILAYKGRGLTMFAFWGSHEEAFRLFEKHGIHPQVWQTAPSPAGETDAEKVAAAVAELTPLARRTADLGCPLGLYNHGGWGGEPANLVAVCEGLRRAGFSHVGVVYNLHHGHGHIADWPDVLRALRPYLICLNLNGMNDGANPKIVSVGRGQHDRAMLETIVRSGYDGPVGIIGHRAELDARVALAESLAGLDGLFETTTATGPPAAGTPHVPSASGR